MLDKPKIIKVLAFHDYLLHIQLSDNRWLRLDMKNFLQYPAYRKLENIGYFCLVKYDDDLLYWDNMHDMHIDQILHFSTPITKQEVAEAAPFISVQKKIFRDFIANEGWEYE